MFDPVSLVQGTLSVLAAFVLAVGAAKKLPTVRRWIKDALSISDMERKVDTIGVLVIDEGEALNELNDTVCNEHDIPLSERPSRIKTGEAKGLFTSEEREHRPGDFLRGGGNASDD